MKRKISDYVFYRSRYVIGYILLIACSVSILVLATLYLPGGLREQEQASAVTSGSLNYKEFDPSTISDLPYHIIQRLSFTFLDVTQFSIKLPSLILGFIALAGIYFLISSWFKRNDAILTSLIVTTYSGFIFLVQDGTSAILSIAVSTWLILCATHVSRRTGPTFLWKLGFLTLLAINLYTPLGVYLDIALLTTIIFHPHIRFTARRLSINRVAASTALALILLIPLIYSIAMRPSGALELLGIPTAFPDMKENLSTLGSMLFGITGKSTSGVLAPFIPIGIAILALIGIYRFFKVKYTAKSYVVALWTIILIPCVLVNPSYYYMLLPVCIITVAMGVSSLIDTWYKMFPRNPYARVFGLLTLSVMVFGLMSTGVMRYTTGYKYMPELVYSFNDDLDKIDSELSKHEASKDRKAILVVEKDQKDFYDLVSRYSKNFSTVTESPKNISNKLVLSNTGALKPLNSNLSYIVTGTTANESDRLYVYTSSVD